MRALSRVDGMDAAQLAGPVVHVARDAARDAAGAAAWPAAWAAARAAAWDAARDAAWDAARAVLAPVVAGLQASAIALYDVLIAGEWPADG